jgi:peptidoglycan/xylan/chitin deacetylase (PgdA/CDA1 family)
MLDEKKIKKISNLLKKFGIRMNGRKKISAILTYHGVTPNAQKNCVPVKMFGEHLVFLMNNYKIISLNQFLEIIESEQLPDEGLVVLTFDDAYENFRQYAYPLLQKFNIPATLYVPANLIGGYNSWDYNNGTSYPYMKIMNSEDLLTLDSSLIELGSHSSHHYRLSQLNEQDLSEEIEGSKRMLENLLKREFTLFAYPYGSLSDFDKRSVQMIKQANYRSAVTTHHGRFNFKDDFYCLFRISVFDDDTADDLRNKLEGYYDWLVWKEKLAFRLKQLVGD